jgi:hypothetical protein
MSVVEEPKDLPTKLGTDADARQIRQWQLLASLQYDVISADIRVPVSLLVLVATFLIQRYYMQRKMYALVKDQQFMIGFGSTAAAAAAARVENSIEYNNSNQSENDVTTSCTKQNAMNVSIKAIHLSEIRDRQQREFAMGSKLSQRQMHSQQHTRKRILHSSLNNDVADDAYRRRMNIIAQEAFLLQAHDNNNIEQSHDELEEDDRRMLLHEQDMEYQQSLQNDQHRARLLALKNDRDTRRLRALDEARQRLVVARIIPHDIDGTVVDQHDSDHDIKLRLLLPSGQKIDGSFSMKHSMGLVYDLALWALDKNNLLWSTDKEEAIKNNHSSNDDADDIDASVMLGDMSPIDDNIYNETQKEWRLLFFPFSIASNYPKISYDDLNSTLENYGFRNQGGGAMALVVVVDST